MSRRARLAKLKAALKPFADVLKGLDLDEDMEDVYLYIGKRSELGGGGKPHLKLADFEKAKEVLGE